MLRTGYFGDQLLIPARAENDNPILNAHAKMLRVNPERPTPEKQGIYLAWYKASSTAATSALLQLA